MKKLEVKDLKENFFEAIGKEWMLVTAGTKEKFNTMSCQLGWYWLALELSLLLLFLSAPNDIRMSSSRKVII